LSPSVELAPIESEDLGEVGIFLHANLNKSIAPDDWIAALLHPWCESRPNFGFLLRHGRAVVGVLCAIYSDQMIDGRRERFCNPHSWCVLDRYRQYGIGLPLAVLKQHGYHFTMLTPNFKVAQIFRQLRFKDLADAVFTWPNLPTLGALGRGSFVDGDLSRIPSRLPESTRRDFELHRTISWLHFLAFGTESDACLVVYKRSRWKRMPCARLIHVSNRDAFDRNRRLMEHHLLVREGLMISQVEARFLRAAPSLSHHGQRTQAKLFLSTTLRDHQIVDLYSELVSLDI
jgi:hypothetical protein